VAQVDGVGLPARGLAQTSIVQSLECYDGQDFYASSENTAMRLSAILIRGSKTLSFAMILLFLAGTGLAQYASIVSPPLTMRSGTILTVRLNQPLSSDHNQVGDVFSASLDQPVIVLGIVVAQRGQTVAGHVVDAKKSGRVHGVSRLGITLTQLTLVDGQTVAIQSQLLLRKGSTSKGRDAAAIAGTAGVGAAIGGAVDGGTGAAVGAAAGAAAGTIGILLTRGDPTVIAPETLLTFQVTAPVRIETNSAPQAFRFAYFSDYSQVQAQSQQASAYPVPPPYPYPYYVYAPPYYPYYSYYPYYYPYFSTPYFYGPSFSFVFGHPTYYGHHGYYGYRGYRWHH
jgi:hypothetical protein